MAVVNECMAENNVVGTVLGPLGVVKQWQHQNVDCFELTKEVCYQHYNLCMGSVVP